VRRPDWQPQLWRELAAAELREFRYGVHDCVILTARCLDAMLDNGGAHESFVRSKYTDKRTALRTLMRGGGMEAWVESYLGAPVARNWARPGDVCALMLDTGPAVGISLGPRVAVAASPSGVRYLHASCVDAVWRVD